jgi:hypothetical protein
MRTLRRGIVAAVLTVTVIVGVASAASAQDTTPFDMPSPSPVMTGVSVPNTTIGYRFADQAIVAVVPDTVNVDDATQRMIEEVVWTTEPVRFRVLEVRYPSGVLHRRSYRELHLTLGERPAGVREEQSLQDLGDQWENLGGVVLGTDTAFKFIKTIAFAVVVFVAAIMLVATILVLVDAQWRRATGTGPRGVSRAGSHPA